MKINFTVNEVVLTRQVPTYRTVGRVGRYEVPTQQSWAHRSLKSLFALERTCILGTMALNKKKSEEQRANRQNQILSGSLISDIRKKECSKNG